MEHINEGAFVALQLSFFLLISIYLLFSCTYQSKDHVCLLCVQQESSLLTVYIPCPDFALLKDL